MATKCPNCGHATAPGQEICGQCHTSLSSADATDESATLSGPHRSPVVNRYRDAYRVAAALVALGNSIKIGGAVLSAVLSIASRSLGDFAPAGFVIAAIAGGLFWICGVIVTAHGETLRATLDTAVASSRFLTDRERAEAMGLPRSVADRQGPQSAV